MEPLEKKVLQKTITYFTENGANVDALLRRLVEDDIISSEDEEAIGHLTTTPQKFYEIYCQAQRRPYFKKFVLALRQTGNDHVADKIMEMYNAKTGTAPDSSQCAGNPVQSPGDDFKLKSIHFVPIKQILENSHNLSSEWLSVQFLLELKEKSMEQIATLKNRNEGFGNIVLQTLRLWVNESPGNASFNKLVAAIESCNKLAAEQLEENREKYKKMGNN